MVTSPATAVVATSAAARAEAIDPNSANFISPARTRGHPAYDAKPLATPEARPRRRRPCYEGRHWQERRFRHGTDGWLRVRRDTLQDHGALHRGRRLSLHRLPEGLGRRTELRRADTEGRARGDQRRSEAVPFQGRQRGGGREGLLRQLRHAAVERTLWSALHPGEGGRAGRPGGPGARHAYLCRLGAPVASARERRSRLPEDAAGAAAVRLIAPTATAPRRADVSSAS